MKRVLEKIFSNTKGYYTHVIGTSVLENLTRFGDNEISQNVSRKDNIFEVRICDGKKAVKFIISKFDDESIKDAIEKAKERLKYSKELGFDLKPVKCNVRMNSDKYFDNSVSFISPQQRADRIKKFLKFCDNNQYLAYGIIGDETKEVIVADNLNSFCSAKFTEVYYEVTISKNGFFGKACSVSWRNDIDYEATNEKALRKCNLSKKIIELKPGKYTVILEPLACVELFGFLGYLGFNALAFYEKRSFVSQNIGKKLFSEKLTIVESPNDFPLPVAPFDLEGKIREMVVLVDKGVIKNVVTDKKTSYLTGLKYTGHSLFEPNPYGAVPVAISVEGGSKTIADIISETDYGILISELHYVNPLKPKTVELTGMTRNGTFLIKDGKVVSSIKNMRFTQSIVEALGNIVDLSKEREAYSFWVGGVYSPAIKIANFNFSSSTDF